MSSAISASVSLGRMEDVSLSGAQLKVSAENGTLLITLLAEDLARVCALPPGQAEPNTSWAVIDREWPVVRASLDETDDEIVVRSDHVSVQVRRSDCSVTVSTSDGAIVSDAGFYWDTGKSGVRWTQPGDRRYYGCGEKAGPLERRGAPMEFWNAEECGYGPGFDPMYHSIPFTLAMDGGVAGGIFVDNTYRQKWDLGRPGDTSARIEADGGAIDVYLLSGPDPKGVLHRWTDLVGRCPLPPLWALGYHQSRWSYYPEKVVRELAAGFRSRSIPCDVIWFDIDYMDAYKDFIWSPVHFPDPAQLISDLHAGGFSSVVMLDPGVKVENGYSVYESLLASGRYVRNSDGSPFVGAVWPGACLFPDFTEPDCRAWWGEQYAPLLDMGIDGFWNDMNEPAVFDSESHTMPDDVTFDGGGEPGIHLRYHNVYGMQMARATFEGLRGLRPNRRPFVLTRAGFAGAHRYAATWTGDNRSDWPGLVLSLPMVMNLGLSGHAISGPDIGGFKGEPSPELFGRWLQANALFPFCRVHSAKPNWQDPDAPLGSPQEPWAFGTEWERINRASIELRYRLLPYLYTVVEEATRTGVPPVRPLMLEYPHDPECERLDDQYLVGTDILVAPVLEEGAFARSVYLPDGGWYDFWTRERFEGGRRINVEAPLDRLPLFVRAGAAIPTQPIVQHTGECAAQPITWLAFLGERAEGDLYEDDGDSMAYLNGAFSITHLSVWQLAGGPAICFAGGGDYVSPRPPACVEIIGSFPPSS